MELEDIKPKSYVEGFDVQTIDGKKIRIGDGSDKPTLLVLFTTWCSSCQEAAPNISKQMASYKDRINLVGIGREHTAADLKEWAEKTGAAYDLVADPDRSLYKKFADIHVPRMYLIDTKGKVSYQDVNWHYLMLEDMEDATKRLLKKKK